MILTDLPADQYHADVRAIGNSGLAKVARSPAHYYAAYLDPHRVKEEPTDAMILGTAWHYAVLQPDEFTRKVVAMPAVDRRTKAGREAYKEFTAAHQGAVVLPMESYDTVRRMRDAMLAHGAARVLLEGEGSIEHSYYWNDPETGVLCKCRPDKLRRDGVVLDLKSTEDARPEAFGRSCWNYRYYVQAAWYWDGLTESLGQAHPQMRPALERPQAFIFIAQEKAPPYSVAVYSADGSMVNAGRMEYRRNLDAYAACLRDDYWPSYPEEILPIELPSWALRTAARVPA